MNHDWMLDVLTDLETYAQNQGLSALAVQLNDTRSTARSEIAGRTAASVWSECEGSAPLAADNEGEARSAV